MPSRWPSGSRYPQARGRKPTVRDGLVFLAMHDASVNWLTHASFDPTSRRPSDKYVAIVIRKLDHCET